MLLERLPSGWPSHSTGSNTGAIGELTPKPSSPLEGRARSAVHNVAVVFPGWAQQGTRASIF